MKNEMFNFAARLEDMLWQIGNENAGLAMAVEKMMADNGLDKMICEEQISRILSEGDCNEFELDIGGGNVDLELYHKISRSIRLLSLAGLKPQKFMSDEADFLSGCPMRYEEFSDDDIDAISFDPNVEAIDDRTFYYVWIYIGEFDEIKMAAKVDSERGTVHPLPFIPVKSRYDVNDRTADKPLTAEERKTMIDRIFYASLIPDEITDDNDEYSEWTEDIEDDEEDEVEWIYPDEELKNDDNEYWDSDDIEECEDNEDEDADDDDWADEFDETDEEDDEAFESDEINIDDLTTNDETEDTSELTDTYKRLNYMVKNIKVLSVTDMNGNERCATEGYMYNKIQGFSGKVPEINVGERMCIFYPEPIIRPGSQMKIHTSPVMFHSEELTSENEVKHIVRTHDSIYTFIEYMK